MTKPSRSLLIVDDDQLLASLLASILAGHNFETQVANDAASAMKILRNVDLDAALLDINLGDGPSGIQLGQALAKNYPGIGIVFLTRTPDLVAAGINPDTLPKGYGLASKDHLEDESELLEALESVLSSKTKPIRHNLSKKSELSALTSHQLDILQNVAAGLTNKAIAQQNSTTERSVERTLQAIFVKLDIEQSDQVNPRVEAVRKYFQSLGLPPRSS